MGAQAPGLRWDPPPDGDGGGLCGHGPVAVRPAPPWYALGDRPVGQASAVAETRGTAGAAPSFSISIRPEIWPPSSTESLR